MPKWLTLSKAAAILTDVDMDLARRLMSLSRELQRRDATSIESYECERVAREHLQRIKLADALHRGAANDNRRLR